MLSLLRYLIYWPINLLVLILAYVLAPILPAFVQANGHLPNWLSWFDTPDNTLNGDIGYRTEHAPFLGVQSGWKQYINQVFWLIRNPSYGFNDTVLAFNSSGFKVEWVKGNHPADGQNTPSGWYLAYATNSDNQGAFQLFTSWQWFSSNHCFRVNIGWKLSSYPGTVQYVFSVNPVKTIS